MSYTSLTYRYALSYVLSGEQFRHLQNVRQSRSHLTASRNFNVPTLPIRLATSEVYESDQSSKPLVTSVTDNRGSCSGPAPPKSWRSQTAVDPRDTPEFRAQALSLLASTGTAPGDSNFASQNRVPPLTLLCLQLILSKSTNSAEFREEIVPYIPEHLRRDLVRHCAVHSPLPAWKLDALYEPEGHADGELIIVGPTLIRDDHFLQSARALEASRPERATQEDWDWETDDISPTTFQSLILLSTPLPTSTLLTIPPTLTTLILINLPSHVPLHRLPKICPLLVIFDLSYNTWLNAPVGEGYKSLERVEWTRWSHLKVLGFRECYIADGLLQRINKGRWDDIDLVR